MQISPSPDRPPPPSAALAGGTDPTAVQSAHARIAQVVGGQLAATPYGNEIRFNAAVPAIADAGDTRFSNGFVAALTDVSTIAVSGADAAAFLHAQLTNDIEHLPPGDARFAGYCTAKGRLLSLFAAWRDADAIRLALSQPVAGPLRKRLAMYVLRSKARLVDEADRVAVLGLAGAAGTRALEALGVAPPEAMRTAPVPPAEADDATWHGTVVGLEPAGLRVDAPQAAPRWLVVLPIDRVEAAWGRLAAHAAPASSSAWRLTEVLAGVPRIAPGAQELFVPQMLNLELVGAVDFRKGCYPGQEVVARSQYLGKLKRRTFAAVVAGGTEPAPGADVLADGAREPVGQVVMAAPDPGGGVAVLFEGQIQAVRDGTLRLSADGAPLVLRDLPYAFPA